MNSIPSFYQNIVIGYYCSHGEMSSALAFPVLNSFIKAGDSVDFRLRLLHVMQLVSVYLLNASKELFGFKGIA